MNNKSISPIIAIVILVGVAIGAAALFYAWFSGVQSGTQEVGAETAGQTALAAGAAMQIQNVNDTGYVTIKNIGSVNLTGINCTSNGNACSNTINNLGPGSTDTSTINCSLSTGVNNIECVSAEGARATYMKLR